MPSPAWFVERLSHGLIETPIGRLVYANQLLPPIPNSEAYFGAVYYPEYQSLLAVTRDGTACYYIRKGDAFFDVKRQTPNFKACTFSVRFTTIAGLAYVCVVDVKAQNSLTGRNGYLKSVQFYADRYYRVALSDAALGWEGVPIGNPDEKLLEGCYQTSGNRLYLSLGANRVLHIVLPEPLSAPYRSGPYDDLAQSVFVFADRGIVCRTNTGWVLYSIDGKLRRWFPNSGILVVWWSDPSFKNGRFYVNARTGPGGDSYWMNVASGKLVKTAMQ